MKFISSLAVAGAMATLASAFVTPAEPIGESVWQPGTKVTITWVEDPRWTTNPKEASKPRLSELKPFDIYLMTGPDQGHIELKKIGENVVGDAKGGSFDYTVDYVDPPGKIYFLTFKTKDTNGTEGIAYSTRFHITDANGVKSSLEPSGAPGQNSGGVGKVLPSPTAAATTTASDPKATAAGNPNSSASAFKISSVAAAVAGFVGAAALTFF
ncbi:hypothetical protein BGZ73_005963 [Actinomortierella ambigua]|nr:hypothetical protein BGZ73_005963 [Actinomortierella ambigua]